MNEDHPAAGVISRYFDNEAAPENDGALAEVLARDPEAVTAFVDAARLDAMLQRQMPRRPARVVWRWIGAGAAAALTTAAVLAVVGRGPGPSSSGGGEPVKGGQHWQPIADVTLPLDGHSAWAQRMWDFYHKAEAESFVPVHDVKVEQWEIAPEGNETALQTKFTATYPEDWKRKQLQAKLCAVETDGTIHLRSDLKVSLGWLSLASPAWPGSRTGPESTYGSGRFHWTEPVYFDHLGKPKPASVRPGKSPAETGASNQWLLTSILELGLRLGPEWTTPTGAPRILDVNVFDAASHAWLTKASRRETPAGEEVILSTETLLASSAAVTVVLDLGAPPKEEDILSLDPRQGSIARNAIFEARVLGCTEGIWSRGKFKSSLGMRGGEEKRSLKPPRPGSIGERIPAKENSCTIALAIPPGQEVAVYVHTDAGYMPPMYPVDPINDRVSRLWCFHQALSSIKSIRVYPLQRHRVIFTVPLPRDPWNGLNDGVRDALSLRLPSVVPATEEARIAVSTFLGIDEYLTYTHYPPLFRWDFAGGASQENLTLREVLQQVEKKTGRPLEMEASARLLRDGH